MHDMILNLSLISIMWNYILSQVVKVSSEEALQEALVMFI